MPWMPSILLRTNLEFNYEKDKNFSSLLSASDLKGY